MPSANPSQRIAEITKELEILHSQSLGHPEKTADISAESIGELLVILKELTTLARGGHD